MKVTKHSLYLDLDGPWEITDIDIEGDIGVASEGELLTGEAVFVLLDVSLGHDGYFLSRDGSSCWGKKFMFSTMPVGAGWVHLHRDMELDRLQHVIMKPLMGLSSHLGQQQSSHEQLLLCLKCIKLLFGWPKTVEHTYNCRAIHILLLNGHWRGRKALHWNAAVCRPRPRRSAQSHRLNPYHHYQLMHLA